MLDKNKILIKPKNTASVFSKKEISSRLKSDPSILHKMPNVKMVGKNSKQKAANFEQSFAKNGSFPDMPAAKKG